MVVRVMGHRGIVRSREFQVTCRLPSATGHRAPSTNCQPAAAELNFECLWADSTLVGPYVHNDPCQILPPLCRGSVYRSVYLKGRILSYKASQLSSAVYHLCQSVFVASVVMAYVNGMNRGQGQCACLNGLRHMAAEV